jgi:hypothetical protein
MTTTTSIVVDGSLVPVTNQLIFTTTLLGDAGVFTSGYFTGDDVGSIAGRAESDQNGTLVLEVSDDGSHWDAVSSHSITGGTPSEFTDVTVGGVHRYVYTNSATPQTSFRLSAYSQGVRSNV